jgi:hypothetical protein
VESFAGSQPESSLGNPFAFAGEVLVEYHKTINRYLPVVIETACWAAKNSFDLVRRLEEKPSSPAYPPAPVLPPDHPDLNMFDNLVGRLMFEARRRHGPRIPKHEYRRIAAEIDQAKLKPINNLEGEWRNELAASNRNARKAIHTFETALRSPSFRRGVLKRIYRAHDKWSEKHPHLSD